MTMVEIRMIVGLVMMFVMMIAVCVVAAKLSEINWTISRIHAHTTTIKDYTSSIETKACFIDKAVHYIDKNVAHIMDEITSEEEECCCDGTEEAKSGYSAEVVVLDEIPIHLITPEMYYFADGYSKNELKYYPNTDQVKYFFTDNTCLAMEDIPEYIGDGLVFFGMNVQEPNVVYVRNHILNADFRIEKVEGKRDE